MGSFIGDVRSYQITAAGSGTVFAGPARILGIYYNSTAGGGSIELFDNAASVFKIDVPDGATTEQAVYIPVPGSGIRCSTSLKYTTTTILEVTVLYG